ncbi:hypothetical protein BT69DRAFT_1356664 [Atractiella rhizophila]|nr:hypothetical protein BT69DRAFT_1356664 [Atractiella rhizophila]
MLSLPLTIVLSSLSFLAGKATAQLGKDSLYSDGLGPHYVFNDKLPFVGGSYYGIDLPSQCASYAASTHDDGSVYCAADQMQAVNVTYSDCSLPYTVCYCNEQKGIHMTLNDVLVQLGRTPTTLRDYTRYFLSFPDTGNHALTWLPANDILMFGDEHEEAGLTVFIHEQGHTIDQSFSSSDTFKNAIAADTCVPDDYANSNEVEDFAQVTVMSLYNDLFGTFPDGPSVSCMQNQLDAYQSNDRINKAAMAKTTCDLSIRGEHNHLKRSVQGRWSHFHSKVSKRDLASGAIKNRSFKPTSVAKGVRMDIIAPSFKTSDPSKFSHNRVAAVEKYINPTPADAVGVFYSKPTGKFVKRKL